MNKWICNDQEVEVEEVNAMSDEEANAEYQRLFGDIDEAE